MRSNTRFKRAPFHPFHRLQFPLQASVGEVHDPACDPAEPTSAPAPAQTPPPAPAPAPAPAPTLARGPAPVKDPCETTTRGGGDAISLHVRIMCEESTYRRRGLHTSTHTSTRPQTTSPPLHSQHFSRPQTHAHNIRTPPASSGSAWGSKAHRDVIRGPRRPCNCSGARLVR